MHTRSLCFVVLLLMEGALIAQPKKDNEKQLQVSLAPALGTNGLNPGSFTNHFSINLTSGYSAANLAFEIAGISNLNTNYTRGLQFAGICNLTGANAFGGLSKKEKEEKIKSGFSSTLVGAQFSGVTNYVTNEVYGMQATGGINLTRGALLGVQVSGISNIVYKYSFGVQLAGVSNVSYESMDGVQISSLYNMTTGGLYGLQLGMFNQAAFTEGKNSVADAGAWGFQIGLVNMADRVNGFQIGLINRAKRSQGTQIGLINFYRPGKQMGTKDGTAIGLLNFGDFGFIAISANEIFATNYELATGNRKNGRIKLSSRNTYVENVLSFSNNSYVGDRWAIGYGTMKMFFNRSDAPGMSEFRFLSGGIHFHQVNFQSKFSTDLNLLSQVKVMLGTRLSPKLLNIYVFTAVTGNFFLTEQDNSLRPNQLSTAGTMSGNSYEAWPGLSLGVMLH